MLAGIATFVAGVLGLVATANVLLLMGARVLQALGYATVSTAATARITDLAPPEVRGARIAQFGIAANLSMTLTPATVDLLMPRIGYTGAFGLAILAALACAALTLTFRETRTLRTAGTGAASADQGDGGRLWVLPAAVRNPWIASLLLGIGFGAWLAYLPLLSDRRNVEPTGLLFALYGIAIIVTRLLTGPWQDKGKERLLLTGGFGAMGMGLALFAFTGTLPTYMLATILVAAGGGIAHPLLMALHVRLMPAAMRGRAVSTFYLAFDLGNGVGVWLLGFALQWWGLSALFGLAACAALAGLPVALLGELSLRE
jgi:MFS family permease